MGQNIVEPEQRGLGPLAVSELAEEFRRLAAEAEDQRERDAGREQLRLAAYYAGHSDAYYRAAQMLEEKLNGNV